MDDGGIEVCTQEYCCNGSCHTYSKYIYQLQYTFLEMYAFVYPQQQCVQDGQNKKYRNTKVIEQFIFFCFADNPIVPLLSAKISVKRSTKNSDENEKIQKMKDEQKNRIFYGG